MGECSWCLATWLLLYLFYTYMWQSSKVVFTHNKLPSMCTQNVGYIFSFFSWFGSCSQWQILYGLKSSKQKSCAWNDINQLVRRLGEQKERKSLTILLEPTSRGIDSLFSCLSWSAYQQILSRWRIWRYGQTMRIE